MAHKDIVVIGGSAGSLQPLQSILSSLPWDFQSSTFVVLHTTEDSPRLLPDILNRHSKVPVMYAVHNAQILPSRVYVAPAGQRHLLIDRGKIRMEAGPRENHSRPAIDAMFRSASYAYGSQVIGVVLSGNLDDGAAGLASIKNRAGLAIVQHPEDSVAPSMPVSAIESTSIDFILPAEQIGPKLIELASLEVSEKLQPISIGERAMPSTGQTYACPECGGVLEEMRESGLMRFRCRVGHQYSPESLMWDQTEAVERALWAAIRSMEEQAEFADRMSESSRQKRRTGLASRFTDKAESSRENAAILRELLQRTADEVFEIPLQESARSVDDPSIGTAHERTGTD
jgi:two-component system, chemotaxis family, protein-glutamate methylesterase/glutaminase